MLKTIGISVSAMSCVLLGFLKSRKLIIRQSSLEKTAEALKLMEIELSFDSPETKELLFRMCEKQELKKLPFFKECLKNCRQKPLAESWREAVSSAFSLCLDREDEEILLALGENLGATDIDGQLSLLRALEERAALRLNLARQKVKELSSLYKTLGILAGIGIVIITI